MLYFTKIFSQSTGTKRKAETTEEDGKIYVDPVDFAIPYEKFPVDIKEALKYVHKENERMDPPLYRKMLRIIAADIHLKYPKPGRQFFHKLAMKYCEEYPAFKVGASYTDQTYLAFSQDLQNRMYNLNRGSPTKTPKRAGAGCAAFAPSMSKNDKTSMEQKLSGLKVLHEANVAANDSIKKKCWKHIIYNVP